MKILSRHLKNILLLIVLLLGTTCKKEQPPSVSKIEVTTIRGTINMTSVVCGGEITSNNVEEIIERGVSWDTLSNPELSDNKIVSGKGSGIFSTEITGLTPGRDYYLRAYAKTAIGVVYGNELKVTTLLLATVNASPATAISSSSATFNGEVISDGGAAVTERGVCWNITAGPTLSNSKASGGSGTGVFTAEMTGLAAATVYYARGYAITYAGTAYGNEISFTTLGPPVITTAVISEITQHTAVSGGNITSDGGASITARGICWGINPLPTITDNKTSDGTGTGIFTSTMTGLLRNTNYYVRAYATNSVATSYGEERSFSTIDLPTVTTTAVSNITLTAATSGGNITFDGGGSVSQRGVCWSIHPVPTISDNKTSDGTGTGTYISNVINLTTSTKYYLRAYAVNNAGTGYGEELSFTTYGGSVPTVVTTAVTNITQGSAQSGGNIISEGGSPVLQRGIYYNAAGDLNLRFTMDGNGPGIYISQMVPLYPFTWYGVRAYATNAAGTGYGATLTFNTLQPTISAPYLKTPLDNANVGCCSVNFEWQPNVYAEFYFFQISRSADFSEAIYSANIACGGTEIPRTTGVFNDGTGGTSYCIRMNDASLNGTWYWRVQILGSGIRSPWSVVRSFNFTN